MSRCLTSTFDSFWFSESFFEDDTSSPFTTPARGVSGVSAAGGIFGFGRSFGTFAMVRLNQRQTEPNLLEYVSQ
jgi:hypothetical protein